MMAKNHKVYETIGEITNGPVDRGKSGGYGFVRVDRDDTDPDMVYVPAHVAKAATLTFDDVGLPARVRYATMPDGRLVAVRVSVMRHTDSMIVPDESVVGKLAALARYREHLEEALDVIDEQMEKIEETLESFDETLTAVTRLCK